MSTLQTLYSLPVDPLWLVDLALNVPAAALGAWALAQGRRRGAVGAAVVWWGGCLGLAVLGAVLGRDTFLAMRLLAWVGFVHTPLALAALAWAGRGAARAAATAAALLIAGVGIDAFLIEPFALEVSTVEVARAEVAAPLRIALIADLQTDQPGDHERRALEAVRDARPDLVVFAGDYVQTSDARYPALTAELAAMLREVGLAAPLGVFAVQGDVDHDDWQRNFEGTGVEVVEQSGTRDLGPVSLTLLSPEDSRASRLAIPPSDDLRVVVGHSPDFALARPDAHLLLAGHTHGGQVQLPGLGPVWTLSALPRDQASGHTRLASGADLVVSRGVGLERALAPRLRFLCRPEVVLIDVVPVDPGPSS